jgi:hypothetical protein
MVPSNPSAMATPASVTFNLGGQPSRGQKQARKLLANHPDMVPLTGTTPYGIMPPNRPTRPNQVQPATIPEEEQPPEIDLKAEARNMDKQYARFVAGAGISKSLSSVWGPRDGSGLNLVDIKRLQEDVYRYIVREVDESMANAQQPEQPLLTVPQRRRRGDMIAPERPTIPPQAAIPDDVEDEPDTIPPAQIQPQTPPPTATAQVQRLAKEARKMRQAFNLGWEDEPDVGILNEVVSTEMEVYLMLKQLNSGVIAPWDKILENADPMLRVRLMRRFPTVCVSFASTVAAAMIADAQMRPAIRPTRYIMNQTSAHAAIHFQMLIGCLQGAKRDLVEICRAYNQSTKAKSQIPVYFIDYNHI